MSLTDADRKHLASVADALHAAAGGALASLGGRHWRNVGRYEAVVESLLMHVLVVRHTEAFCALARTEPMCLAAAQVLARAVFEASVRCLWMLAPEDPFDREGRWLALLHEWEDVALRSEKEGATTRGLSASQIQEFRRDVEGRLLERGHAKARGTTRNPAPSMPTMLSDLARRDAYVEYARLSQPVHGTLAATAMYRDHLGDAKELAEHVDLAAWCAEAKLVWQNLDALTGRVIKVMTECGNLPSDHPPYITEAARSSLSALVAPRALLRSKDIRRLTSH